MKPRSRILTAISHKPGKLPYQLDLTSVVHRRLSEKFGSVDFLYTEIGNHIACERYKELIKLDEQRDRDYFGVIFRKDSSGDIGVVEGFPLTEADIGLYKFPQMINASVVEKRCKYLCTEHMDRFKIFMIGFSLFERAWSLRGMENVLSDMLLEKRFLHELLERITEHNLKVIDFAAQYNIDCIMLGDDWGQQNGLIMGARLWREFIKPCVKLMYDRVKKYNLFAAQHSCGDNRDIMGDLADMGLDIYNTFQPEIYSLEKFKSEYGSKITVYGGISTQGVLARGTPEEVYDTTCRTIDIMARDGGYIAAPTHSVTQDISDENIFAFLKAVKKYT